VGRRPPCHLIPVDLNPIRLASQNAGGVPPGLPGEIGADCGGRPGKPREPQRGHRAAFLIRPPLASKPMPGKLPLQGAPVIRWPARSKRARCWMAAWMMFTRLLPRIPPHHWSREKQGVRAGWFMPRPLLPIPSTSTSAWLHQASDHREEPTGREVPLGGRASLQGTESAMSPIRIANRHETQAQILTQPRKGAMNALRIFSFLSLCIPHSKLC
jgi:hypothetical protein